MGQAFHPMTLKTTTSMHFRALVPSSALQPPHVCSSRVDWASSYWLARSKSFLYKRINPHFARGYDWNLLFATCIVTRVTLLLGAVSLSFVWPT